MAGRVGRRLGLAGALLALAVAATPAAAQDKPRYGGELIFAVPSEMPSYDGHREGTFGMVHPLAPHYNTLLRSDPNDRSGTKIVPDLAESWTASSDGRVYTLQQHRIIPHSAKVKGWTVTPSHVLNNQLDTVWLAE